MGGDIAKATEEVAKAASKAMELFDKYFGGTMENIGGIAQDTTGYWRLRNSIKTMERTEKLILEKGLNGKIHRIPKRQLPLLISGIADEDDESIQEVWAEYIAAGLADADGKVITRQLTAAIKALEPDDLKILNFLFASDITKRSAGTSVIPLEDVAGKTGLSDRDAIDAMGRMATSGLLSYSNESEGAVLGLGGGRKDFPGRIEIQTHDGDFRAEYLLLQLYRALKKSNQSVSPA